MKTLLEIYNEISENHKKYMYYNNLSIDISLKNVWENAEKANSFIHGYFDVGGKVVFNVEKIKYFGFENKRDIHTVSVFILGIAIAEKIGYSITREELFIWFLMCLYHDMGYAIENDASLISKAANLERFIELVNVKGDNNIFNLYRGKTLCKNYYKYVRDKFNHIDHGIAGGIILYSKLVENYFHVKNTYKYDNEDFIHNGLLFSKKLFDEYKEAAIGIIRHNMWFAHNDEEKKQYEKYHLESLIISKDNLISVKENKLLFLLCLADTLEPLKHFYNVKSKCVLNGILMKVNKSEILIKINENCLECYNYIKKINSLKNWLDVNIEKNTYKTDEVVIYIN